MDNIFNQGPTAPEGVSPPLWTFLYTWHDYQNGDSVRADLTLPLVPLLNATAERAAVHTEEIRALYENAARVWEARAREALGDPNADLGARHAQALMDFSLPLDDYLAAMILGLVGVTAAQAVLGSVDPWRRAVVAVRLCGDAAFSFVDGDRAALKAFITSLAAG